MILPCSIICNLPFNSHPMALCALSPQVTTDHSAAAFLLPKLHHPAAAAAPFPANKHKGGLKWRANASFFSGLTKKNKRSKYAEAIKEELLEAIEPLDCGSEATPEVNPTREPLKSDLLNGKWELIYTTSQPILQTLRPKLLRSRRNYQAINADNLRAQNMESAPFFKQVTADFTPLNAKKFAVKFDFFKLGGLSLLVERLTTYLDQELRVSRGDKGNLFVLKMVDPS